jgi:poly-gamma-glutamate biosynthesis protein PgsC/CapC
MLNVVVISVGIGLIVSLLLSELFALSAGGMVATGYVALYLNRPVDVALTIAASLVTLLIVRGIARFVIMYGRRQILAMILVGYLMGAGVNLATTLVLALWWPESAAAGVNGAIGVYRTIGYIVPGLIAIWLDRQGITATVCALLTGSVLVRLVLILTFGAEVLAKGHVYLAPLVGRS